MPVNRCAGGGRRVLAVCLNPALDITYEIDALHRSSTHRVRRVHMRAGGKGVNVAWVLQALGVSAAVAGFAGGATGRRLDEELGQAGLETRWVWVEGETRRCLAVFEQGVAQATEFNEPGPTIATAAWEEFVSSFAEWVRRDEFAAVVFSGSLPPGLPADAYARLIRLARSAGVYTVLDTSGEALRQGLAAGPHLVKPNLRELEELLERMEHDVVATRGVAVEKGRAAPDSDWQPPVPPTPAKRPSRDTETTTGGAHVPPPGPCDRMPSDPRDRSGAQPPPGGEHTRGDADRVGAQPPWLRHVRRAAEVLRRRGPKAVVVSLGADGVVAVTPAGTWRAQAPAVRGNPVGAGDALVAGLVYGILRGSAWPERLAHGVAVAAAAVASPVAGRFEPETYASLRPQVRVVPLSSEE